MGITLNTEKQSSHKYKGILGILPSSLLLSLPLNCPNPSRCCNTGFSAWCWLHIAKNKYMPHLFMEKGSSRLLQTVSHLGPLALWFFCSFLIWNTERLILSYYRSFRSFALSNRDDSPLERKALISLKSGLANILGAIIRYAIVLILLFFRLEISGPSSQSSGPNFPPSAHPQSLPKGGQQLRLYEGIQKKTYDGNVVLVLVEMHWVSVWSD